VNSVFINHLGMLTQTPCSVNQYKF